MKKIINDVENVLIETCRGIEKAYPELEFHEDIKVFTRQKVNKDKVALISGGGTGHEPAHAGLVGKGMLDAAVCGEIFSSPSQIQVYKAIREVTTDKGVLLIIKNYSGDLMNFRNAAHLAAEDGIKVDFVKVDDDIAVEDSLYTVGRRGVAGTLFVHKIAGAAAEQGKSLEEVKRLAQKAIDNTKSLGFALTSCTVPAMGVPTFKLKEDEIEYGVGIHGEPGIKKAKIASADELTAQMLSSLIKELNLDGKKEVAVLINGFGGSPLQELYLLAHSVDRYLAKENINTYKTFVGNYMTSLDMTGASVTLMALDDELKELLSQSCDTPAFKVTEFIRDPERKFFDANVIEGVKEVSNGFGREYKEISDNVVTLKNIQYMVDTMSNSAIKNEIPFCEMDAHAGDGDFGMSIAKGFRQLKKEWNNIVENESQTIETFLNASSLIIMEYCGGASGPIWGSGFRGAAKSTEGKTSLNLEEFAQMLQDAVKGIQDVGERSFGRGAVVGDKTLIDALVPCADSLTESAKAGEDILGAMHKAAEAAKQGAEATKNIVARMGRAGTVGERSLGHPDAGAQGLATIFNDVVESMR